MLRVYLLFLFQLTYTTVLQIRHLAKLQDTYRILCNFPHKGKNQGLDIDINFRVELCTHFLVLQCCQLFLVEEYLCFLSPLNQHQTYHLRLNLNLSDH